MTSEQKTKLMQDLHTVSEDMLWEIGTYSEMVNRDWPFATKISPNDEAVINKSKYYISLIAQSVHLLSAAVNLLIEKQETE